MHQKKEKRLVQLIRMVFFVPGKEKSVLIRDTLFLP